MTKLNLVELALRGLSSDILAKNIASMNPSMIIASRIINGIQMPTMEQATAYIRKRSTSYQDAEIVSMEMRNAFEECCVRVEFEYTRTVYWDKEYTQPEEVAAVSYDDFRQMDRVANCRERADETYKYKMVYLTSQWDNYCPEDMCEC